MIDDEEDWEEETWASICAVAAMQAGISTAQAKSILADAGFHAYGHTGILEAVNVVRHAYGLPELLPDDDC